MGWVRVLDKIPNVAEDILAGNNETGQVEFGFLSQVDIDNGHPKRGWWCDFSFRVTHWMYIDPLPEP